MLKDQIKNISPRLLAISACSLLIGCTALKKSTVVATGAAVGATAGTVASSGMAAPIIGALGGGFITDFATELGSGGASPQQCAPTNFFDLIEALIHMAGYGLLAVLVVPMVLGWILPGPLERKKKKT